MEGGCSAIHWTQQQLFPVDIDNEDVNSSILTLEKALDICKKCKILPVIYYKSFSHTEEKPKFRLIFAMNKLVEMEERREFWQIPSQHYSLNQIHLALMQIEFTSEQIRR